MCIFCNFYARILPVWPSFPKPLGQWWFVFTVQRHTAYPRWRVTLTVKSELFGFFIRWFKSLSLREMLCYTLIHHAVNFQNIKILSLQVNYLFACACIYSNLYSLWIKGFTYSNFILTERTTWCLQGSKKGKFSLFAKSQGLTVLAQLISVSFSYIDGHVPYTGTTKCI